MIMKPILKDKDVLGYFMLTTKELVDLQKFNPAYREEQLTASLQKAQSFALKHIAPMTDPNPGASTSEHATRGTPRHYAIKEDLKRSFQLGVGIIWRPPATAACSASCRSCCSHRGTSNHDFSTRRRSDE